MACSLQGFLVDYRASKHALNLQHVRETVNDRELFTVGWFGVREKYCSGWKFTIVYDLANMPKNVHSPFQPLVASCLQLSEEGNGSFSWYKRLLAIIWQFGSEANRNTCFTDIETRLPTMYKKTTTKLFVPRKLWWVRLLEMKPNKINQYSW